MHLCLSDETKVAGLSTRKTNLTDLFEDLGARYLYSTTPGAHPV